MQLLAPAANFGLVNLPVILAIGVLVTSIISGILGMGGGMILMGLYGLLLTVPVAMVLHGVTQFAANGSRAWIHRRAIRWAVDAVGAGKLMWGTDYPRILNMCTYQQSLDLFAVKCRFLTAKQKDAILGETARKLVLK